MIGFIGVGAGLIGAFAGIAAIVWGLGYLEYLGGKKKSYLPLVGKDSLRARLLSLNNSGLPYDIKPSVETDLAVEWNIMDSQWFDVFARERLTETFRALIVLDETRKTARYYEEMGTVQWRVGTQGDLNLPAISYQNQFFKGRILFQKSWGVQYGIKDDGKPGKIYEYKFDIGYIRDPIKKTVEESGWEFVPVVRKEHATFRSLTPRLI